MRLSLQTDYALRTLMFLAVKDGHHSIADIASAYGISKNHLMKVAQRLTAEGFVDSVRGRSGGLKLAHALGHFGIDPGGLVAADRPAFKFTGQLACIRDGQPGVGDGENLQGFVDIFKLKSAHGSGLNARLVLDLIIYLFR